MKYSVDPELTSKIKLEYIQGKGSVREIAERYGVVSAADALKVRGSKEKWRDQRETYLNKVSEKGLKKAESRVEAWLERVLSSGEKDWEIIEKSLQGLGDQVDPEAILGYVRARKLIDDMARRSMGLSDQVSVDVKSGGKSMEETLLSVLSATRSLVESGKIDPKTIDVETLSMTELED